MLFGVKNESGASNKISSLENKPDTDINNKTIIVSNKVKKLIQ